MTYSKYVVIDGIKYRITKRKLDNENSNYDCMLNIFRVPEQTPIIGFPCKESFTINEQLSDLKMTICQYNKTQNHGYRKNS